VRFEKLLRRFVGGTRVVNPCQDSAVACNLSGATFGAIDKLPLRKLVLRPRAPPIRDHMTVPWVYLGFLFAAAAASTGLAALFAERRHRLIRSAAPARNRLMTSEDVLAANPPLIHAI
jgi:hypothetical protein